MLTVAGKRPTVSYLSLLRLQLHLVLLPIRISKQVGDSVGSRNKAEAVQDLRVDYHAGRYQFGPHGVILADDAVERLHRIFHRMPADLEDLRPRQFGVLRRNSRDK